MSWNNGRRVLGTEPEVGFYRFRAVKNGPWQPCRIFLDGGLWHCLVRGDAVEESGKADPFEIPFLVNRWPMHPITAELYDALIVAYRNAPAGSPLRTPDRAVDLRNTPATALYRGKAP